MRVPLSLVGPSAASAAARAALLEAAGRRGPVLITAEPGCRPVDIARSLHEHASPAHPLVLVDCGATDSREVEELLFGGPARRPVASPLECVTGDAAIVKVGSGTLFLDNIEELSTATQRRLARVLRDNQVRVPRSRRPVAAAFRLVAATSRDLVEECRTARFSRALLRRLTGFRITVPPLRQRAGDIPDVIAALPLEPAMVFTPPALAVLTALPWLRNIDELIEIARRLAEAGAPAPQEDLLPPRTAHAVGGSFDLTVSLREARRRFERDYIAAVLGKHGWSVSEAALALGIERANLYRKVRQVGLALPSTGRIAGTRS